MTARQKLDLPTRIDLVRRHGLEVSDDGFVPTLDGPIHIDDCPTCRLLTMTPRQRLDAAMDRLAERLAESCRKSAEREREKEREEAAAKRGLHTAWLRKMFGYCQRCGIRPPSGGPMCAQCWVDTGEPR
jgi:hypothetical protein